MKLYLILFLILLLGGFLRFYKIDLVPPGLYIDEISIGYNAYTIMKEGRDEYGKKYPLWFKAYGEYKMPLYIYASAVSMKIFGKNDFSVRFPSALAGTLSILFVFLICKALIEIEKRKILFSGEQFGLVAAFLFAITPWNLNLSRAGFEATIGLFLYLIALFFSIKFITSGKLKFIVISSIFFALTFYAYSSYRIITPVTLLGLGILIFFKYRDLIKKLILGAVIVLILSIPVMSFSLSSEGSIRFFQTSAFAEFSNKSSQEKQFIYPMIFLKNYISFYSPQFLFVSGDGFARHVNPGFGPLFRWEIIPIILGFFYLFQQNWTLLKKTVLFLLTVVPLGAAIAVPSPHVLRSLPLILPYVILASVGIIFLWNQKIGKKIIAMLTLVAVYEIFLYSHYYYHHYPRVNNYDWGSGYRQMVETTKFYKSKYDEIVIDQNLKFAPLYFKFYEEDIKYSFVPVTWNKPEEWKDKKVLYVRPFYGDVRKEKIFYNLTFNDRNKTIYGQFWEL